jgi:hypothetical protein
VILQQGTKGKPHEPEKRRRTTNAGVPHSPLSSRDRAVVVLIND